MTENEIIRRLSECYLGQISLGKETVSLINRQNEQIEALIAGQETLQRYIAEKEAEIERLREDSKRLKKVQMQLDDLCIMHHTIRAEAIKEFADRLKADIVVDYENPLNSSFPVVTAQYVDDLVKEMVGDNNG